MLLVVDVGNSRMKWALYDARGWLAQGVVPNAEIGTLALRDWQNLPRPVRAIGVTRVGATRTAQILDECRRRLALNPVAAEATDKASPVLNGY